MSFVDKFKKILFDDVDDNEELPERTPKGKKEEKHESSGFIDYHNNEEDEENPIREIKIPKQPEEEKEVPKVAEEANNFKFPDVRDFDDKIPTRERNYEDMNLNFFDEEPEEEIKLVKEVNSFTTEKAPQKKKREIKDYRKMLSADEEPSKEKKPFTNTPVISPVWGILDKNYKPEEIVDRTETLTKLNTGAVPRSYGPVSYNDQPLVQKKKEEKALKEKKEAELIELNTAITDLINEPIEEQPKVINKPKKVSERELPNVIQEEEVPKHSIDDIDDDIIKTDNYDDIEEVNANYNNHSIETEEKANNNIEDAFESTSEFDSIRENDSVEEYDQEDEEELVDLDSIVNKTSDDETDDDAGLDNTIETDLFNLIDSMYKDEDE